MSIGLVNAKLSGRSHELPTQRVAPAHTSIAEEAKFIPKPRKRVSFQVVTNSNRGSTGEFKDIPLPGQASESKPGDVSGRNIAMGSLGKDGLTATMTKDIYSGKVARVKMVVDYTPEKDHSFTPTQEEGRQTNHADAVHYTQQYDSYGRPIIGFSREPYDFAATKYIAKTSEIKFQQNVKATRTGNAIDYNQTPVLGAEEPKVQTIAANEGKPAIGPEPIAKGENNPKPEDIILPGEQGDKGEGTSVDANILVGQGRKNAEPQEILGQKKEVAEPTIAKGISVREIAEKMGIDFNKLFRPENAEAIANSHNVNIEEAATAVSVSA